MLAQAGSSSPTANTVIFTGLLGGAVTALVSFATAWLTTRRQITNLAIQQRYAYTLERYRLRLEVYGELFALMEPLAIDGRARPSIDRAEKLAVDITAWYYGKGGLIVTDEIREKLLDLRAELRNQPTGHDRRNQQDRWKAEYEPRSNSSDLRTLLVKDLDTRSPIEAPKSRRNPNGPSPRRLPAHPAW